MPLPREIVLRRLTGRRRVVGALVAAAVALVAAALGVSSPAAAQTQPFTDISQDAYYSEAVGALAGGGVFDGTECAQGMLCPGEPIDRKTMAVWTVRALDGEDPAQILNSRFSDVAADSFHGPFIERMAELGVTTGCGDGTAFCPDNAVTRNQMAVFLTRAFKLDPGPDPGFSDVALDAWYYNEVAALAASGITTGCGDGTAFCPSRQTTRAQMAAFLARATGLIELPTTTPDSASPYPVTVILPNIIVTIDSSGQRHTIRAETTDCIGDLSASISPDGRRVAYWNCDGELFVTNRDGTDTKQIVSNNSTFHGWSPDSRWFAYSTSPRYDGELVVVGGLFVTNRDGTDTREIYKDKSNDGRITSGWSPDSTRIAYWGVPAEGLLVYSVDGSGTQQIAETILNSGDATVGLSWSPDGSRIAYTTGSGYRVSNADGTDARDLVDVYIGGEASSPAVSWSPDGSHIVLTGQGHIDETGPDKYIVGVEGTDLIDSYSLDDIFPDNSPSHRVLGWSQDGRLVAYSAYRRSFFAVLSTSEDGQILSLEEFQNYDFYKSDAELQRSSEWQRSLGVFQEFSPDGRNILSVLVNNDGSLILTVSSSDYEFAMSNPDSVLRFERYGPGPAVFSPDGTKIAYMSPNGIAAIDLTNGEESPVLDYSDIISDASAESGTEMHVCSTYRHRASLQWTQSGVRATAALCSTP